MKSSIHVDDCIAGMRRDLADGSIDLVVTSPPYNLGMAYGAYKDQLSEGAYLAWCGEWTAEVRRVLSDGGSFFLNLGSSPSQPTLPMRLILQLVDAGWHLQNTFHWIKSISVPLKDRERTVGHFKPINSKRFVTDCHEPVFHLTKTGDVPLDRRAVGVPYEHKSNIGRWAHTGGADLRCRGNNWFIPYETITNRSKDRPHPATFPVALPERCIRLHGRCEELTVLDPFLGLGSSWEAAKRCGVREFRGYDVDAEYVAGAKDRVEGDGGDFALEGG